MADLQHKTNNSIPVASVRTEFTTVSMKLRLAGRQEGNVPYLIHTNKALYAITPVFERCRSMRVDIKIKTRGTKAKLITNVQQNSTIGRRIVSVPHFTGSERCYIQFRLLA